MICTSAHAYTGALFRRKHSSFVTPSHLDDNKRSIDDVLSSLVFFQSHLVSMSEHSSSYQSKASTTRYTSDFSSPFPSHVEQQLHEVREYTIHQFENSRMMISETQAKLLNQLIKLVHAKRVLEIGTYTGYSAIAQAAALPPNGKMITLDINEATQAIARRYLEKAKLLDKVKLQLGPAADR